MCINQNKIKMNENVGIRKLIFKYEINVNINWHCK